MPLENKEEMWIVPKVEEGMDKEFIRAVTYQMRNPFTQFHDACANVLDLHCYLQHKKAAELVKTGQRVLDVCCGRGLLIPFLRFGGAPPSLYVGVDIEEKNCRWVKGRDPRQESRTYDDWGFRRAFVNMDVSEMGPVLLQAFPRRFHVVVFTSSIEHMHPVMQQETLKHCYDVATDDGILYLTCPVTHEGDGFDTQYPAHVYEPKQTELYEWLDAAGWKVRDAVGLATKSNDFRAQLKGKKLEHAEYLYSILPRMQALVTIAALYPESATEMSYVCYKEN